MRELDDVLRAYRLCTTKGTSDEPLLMATVVRVVGSTYRRIGARMLMSSDRHLAGAISGGCLESDVLQKALWRTTGGAALVRYDSRSDDDLAYSLGLGCNGLVDVLVERLEPESPTHVLEALAPARRAREPLAIVTVVDGGVSEPLGARVLVGADGRERHDLRSVSRAERLASIARYAMRDPRRKPELVRYDGVEVLVEVIPPPTPVVIFGTGIDVAPVVELCKGLGWEVTVVGTRPVGHLAGRFPLADRTVAVRPAEVAQKVRVDPDTLALLMTHNLLEDVELLAALLPSPARYIGVLGPRARRDRLLEQLEMRGVRPTREHLQRLFAPVGLDLGAEGPHEIALSIVGEMRAFLGERAGGFLRDREAPIHEHPDAPVESPAETGVPACALNNRVGIPAPTDSELRKPIATA